MSAPVSLLPPIVGASLPPPNPQGLSDDEQRLIAGLSNKLTVQSTYIRLRYQYYDAEQLTQNLGISVPQVLAGVRTVVDWPRVTVDRPVERAARIDGFRLPDATEIDDELGIHWQANDLDSELPLAIQDSLVARCGYMVVGSPDEPGDSPIVTVESPLNLALVWDPRTRTVTSAFQSYEVEGIYKAALYLPDQTISMSRDESRSWVVDNRDFHLFGEVPVVRFPNRARASDREGRSEITPAIMATTDSACRSLLGMEIAREVYSIPHLAILGASESDFVDSQGNKKSPLQMALTHIIAMERDENGDLPQLQQLKAFDPAVFTKIIDEHAQLMSSYTGFPPQYFGQTTTANPASADAIRVSDYGIKRAADRVQLQSTAPMRRVAQLMWRFANGGAKLPGDLRRVEVSWTDTAIPTPAATSDKLTKEIAAGMVPPTSDVTLEKAGYTAIERARLAQDRDVAQQFEAELTASVVARQMRAGNALATDAEKAAGLDQPATAPIQPPA